MEAATFRQLRSIDASVLETLFDRTPDTVFFIKNRDGEYVVVNETLVRRCGGRSKAELLGRTAVEVFGRALGTSFQNQDLRVIEQAVEIKDRLELHFYPGRQPGWCLTHKVPLKTSAGEVTGLIGVSKDLHHPDRGDSVYSQVARAVEVLQVRFAEPLRVQELARLAGLSLARFERCIQGIFGLTPRQLLAKTRLEEASRMLREEPRVSVAEVAHACGYSDHSAFTRHFKSVVGLTPSEFRRLER